MKKIIVLITVSLLSLAVFSQEQGEPKFQQSKHEVSVWAAGGLSTLNYDLSLGDRDSWNFGYMAGLGYTYFFNYNWGLGTGVEFSVLKSSLEIKDFTDNYYAPAFSGADKPLYLSVRGTNYNEDYTAYYINIPILVKYQLDVFKQHKFYAAGGMKIGIPVEGKYSASGSHKALAYDIDSEGNPIGDAMSGFHGLGEVNQVNVKDVDYDLKTNFILSLESGMKWRLNNKLSLYTGLFFDYGLTDIRKGNKNLRVARYLEDDAMNYAPATNPVLNSVHGMNAKAYTKKARTMSAGLKLQLAFGLNPKIDRKFKVIEEKPYEGVTPQQMEQILQKNTDKLVVVIEENFDELYKKLEKEAPELFEPIPTDEIESIVQFDFDKDDLKNVYVPDVDRKIVIMKKYPEVKITLVGHTDNRGSAAYNYELGLHRAQAVKNYMVENGISSSRLYVESKGDTQPIAPNDTESNRYKNRRVEFEMRK